MPGFSEAEQRAKKANLGILFFKHWQIKVPDFSEAEQRAKKANLGIFFSFRV